MSKYQQHLTIISDPQAITDYSVDEFIDDVEETLNLEGKGYIACIQKIMFDAKEMIILNKQLEEADKQIAHKNKKFSEWCVENKELTEKILEQAVEYDKLKEKNDELENMLGESYSKHDVSDLKEENEKLKEDMKKTWDYVSTCGDTVESGLINLLNPPASDEESEEESEEEDLYGDDDDWVWADVCGSGGYRGEKDEYTLHISGGGDPNTPNGFENWVIKKNVKDELEYFIRHGGDIPDKKQVGKILVRSPDGKYVSWQDEDYEFREVDGDRENDFEWLLEDEEFVSYQVKEMAVLSEVITEYLKDPKPITKEMGEMMDEVIKALSEV